MPEVNPPKSDKAQISAALAKAKELIHNSQERADAEIRALLPKSLGKLEMLGVSITNDSLIEKCAKQEKGEPVSGLPALKSVCEATREVTKARGK